MMTRRYKMANIFFDLDGTLVNSKVRLYTLFCELCPKCNFSYGEYWVQKRSGITQSEILKNIFHYNLEQILDFKVKWLNKIEEKARLNLDRKINNIDSVLENILYYNDLYIVTNRQRTDFVLEELKSLRLYNYFKKIFVTNQKISKSKLISKELLVAKNDIFVGDTGEDILAAKKLGIKSIAVTWGHLKKEILEKYKPGIIADTPTELGCILKKEIVV